MALYGAVGEGWSYSGAGGTPGPRYGDFQFRGKATVTGSLVITLPLPIRFAGFPTATLVDTTPAGTDIALVTVGNITGASFTIYCWKATSSAVTTLVAATAAFTVNWQAFGSISDNFISGAY